MAENKFQREVLDRLIVLETLLKEQDYKSVKKNADEALSIAIINDKRIGELEGNVKWIVRLIVGSVVSGILYAIFKM